jgi:hypothetical protein
MPRNVAELTKFLRDQSTIAAYPFIRRESFAGTVSRTLTPTPACNSDKSTHPVKGLLTG